MCIHREDTEEKQLIFMAIKYGRGQGTNELTIPPSQQQQMLALQLETHGASGPVWEPKLADRYLRDAPLLTVDTELWAR